MDIRIEDDGAVTVTFDDGGEDQKLLDLIDSQCIQFGMTRTEWLTEAMRYGVEVTKEMGLQDFEAHFNKMMEGIDEMHADLLRDDN